MTTASLIDRYRRTRAGTRRIVAALPDEYFGWRPRADTFSCGDLVRHLIQAEIAFTKMLVAASRNEPFDPLQLSGTGEERLKAVRGRLLAGSGDTKYGINVAECLARWSEIQARTESELMTIPDAALSYPVDHPILNLRAPLWDMFIIMQEHEIHHRGQLSAYMKMIGIEQPVMLY